ncbi:MucBP domain-containing protein [Enterococcus raffinosus]|uniref:MucBP domain-containing protein n=1 Tax=Enterococcus raffinosus TaxID=71452 RepID=UPI001C10E674|nr:MucBP domain-containing protein [Enterococcus raffinosus]MBU5361615.1 MucBP domain-containing protein [Enterococcus raffinosus]
MKRHYIRCLAVLSMIVGVCQFGAAEGYAEELSATVTTEYALYDSLSPAEQKNLITEQPEATITHDEENFRLIYQKKAAEPVNQANKTTEATLQQTTRQTSTHQVLQSTYKTLPKTGEQMQNNMITYFGIIFLAAGSLLLIWKRRQAKKALLVLVLVGGTGFTSISAAATLELPAAKTEKLDKGSAFKPDTSVSGYDYLGYIHSTNDHNSSVIPEKKEGTVLVHFVDEEGNTLAQAETLTGNVGEQYKSEAKTITGYILKEVQGNATGKFTDQQQEVTYVYAKEPVKGADVIVHYVDEEGNIIAPDVMLTGSIGEQYTSEEKAIEGYLFKEVQGNATGKFTEQQQEVTYVYEKEKQLGRVIVDFSEITSNIGRNFYVYIDEEGVPIWTSVKAEGFFLYDTNYSIPDNGKLELDGEVGTKVVGPSGLNLEVSEYHPLGIVYLDSEGVKQVAEIPGTRVSFNEQVPLNYTEENQTIVYHMYVPN